MIDLDASLLFPSETVSQATPAGPVASAATPPRPAEPVPTPAAVKPEETGPDASKLFDTEAKAGEHADYSGAFDKLDDLALSLKLSGENERSSQLVEATDVMFEDAIVHGTPPDTVREISEFLHEAAGTLGEISPEALADGQARGLRELTDEGVTEDDLAIARSMVKSMESRIPNLAWQLEKSGLGNDVRFIKSLIVEGKRRAASIRR